MKEIKEQLDKNDIITNSYISTEIGKITFSNQNNDAIIYCTVNLDGNDEKKIEIKNIKEEEYTKQFLFVIEDNQSTLSYKFFLRKQINL